MSSDSEVQVKFSAEIKGLLEGLKSAQDHTKEAAEGMTGDLGSLITSFEHFGFAAVAIGAAGLALEGVHKAFEWVEEAVEKTIALSRAFEGLNYQTGATFESLNTLNSGMMLTGGDIGQLESWMKGATRAMKNNADMLVANGIAADKASLMSIPFTDYLQKVMAAADSIDEPFRRSIFLTEALGRAGMEAAPQIKRLLAAMGSGEAQESFETFGKGIDEHVKTKMEEVEKALGRVKIAQQAVDIQLGVSSSDWAIAWGEMKLGYTQFLDSVVGGQTKLKDALANMGLSIFGGKSNAEKQTVSMAKGALDEMEAVPAGPATTVQAGPAKPIRTKEEIEAAKKASEEAKKQYSKDLADNMAQEAESAKWRINLEKASDDMIAEIQEGNDRQAAAMSKLAAQDQMNASKDDLQRQKNTLDQKVAFGQISAQQELAQRKQLLLQEAALDIQALEREKATLNLSLVERTKVENQIQALKHKTNQSVQALDNQAILDQKAKWDGFFGSMTGGFDSAIKGMIHGTMTWGQATQEVLNQALDGLISYFVQWGEKEAIRWAASLAMGVAGRDSEAIGAAAVYAVNAAASVAAIPVYGWALAPGVMAEAYSSGLAMAGLASAAGGWADVPADQVAMIHKNEMVLPAYIAAPLRSALSGGGGVTAGATGGGGDMHFHINAVDAQSFVGMLNRNQGGLMTVISQALRNGRRS